MKLPLWRRRRREEDLEEEIQSHLQMAIRDRMERGESAEEAESAARREFGNLGLIKETTRGMWKWAEARRFFDDMRYGLRMLRKTPGWTAIMCAVLALGIGLTTAIFSLTYGILLRALPYPDPERIVALYLTNTVAAAAGYPRFGVSAATWLEWRAQTKLFEDIALTRVAANFNLTGDGPPERVQGARASWNLPRTLGVQPLLGRAFTEEEALRDAKVAVLSYGFWDRRFARDPAIVSRKILL
ncbi:MAG: permease prefix domain 1-containing protein, partial [Blastocatellia bacterium]